MFAYHLLANHLWNWLSNLSQGKYRKPPASHLQANNSGDF